jgi:hypothetical protein
VGQAAGAVLSHAAFLHMNISPLRSALLRLIGGIVGVLIFMPLRSNHELSQKKEEQNQQEIDFGASKAAISH